MNKRITTAQFIELVAPGKPAQLHLFAEQGREEARQEILALHLRKLVFAAVAGVLPVPTLTDMLLCKDSDKRPVIAGASKAASELLVKTIDDLEFNELVTPKDAHRLQARIVKAVRAKH